MIIITKRTRNRFTIELILNDVVEDLQKEKDQMMIVGR